jgi:hypothetical protein
VPSTKLRLSGGGATYGRLEAYLPSNAVWAVVSAPGAVTPTTVAAVACAELGYNVSVADTTNTYLPRSDTVVNWALFNCDGSEGALTACTAGGWDVGQDALSIACFNSSTGTHLLPTGMPAVLANVLVHVVHVLACVALIRADTASVAFEKSHAHVLTASLSACPAAATPYLPGAVRLQSTTTTPTTISGRVELLAQGVWVGLCPDNLGPNAARVLCRQLGYGDSGGTLGPPDSLGSQTTDSSVYLSVDDASCPDTSASLAACGLSSYNTCQAAALTCTTA